MVSELHGFSCCMIGKAVTVLSVVRYLLVILCTCAFQSCMVEGRSWLLHDKLAMHGTMQQSCPHCTHMIIIYDYTKWKSCESGKEKKETKNSVCERVRSRPLVVRGTC